MDKLNLINLYFLTRREYFPKEKISHLKSSLKTLDKIDLNIALSLNYDNPVMVFFISFFFGVFGIDRLLIKDFGLGIFKLITLGGLGIWAILDLFFIIKRTKSKNAASLLEWIATLQQAKQ